MTSTGTTITIDDGEVTRALDLVLAAGRDTAPIMKILAQVLVRQTKDRIKDGKTPQGTPFAPLNPLYRKTKKGPGILRGATGHLRNLIAASNDATQARASTALPYARIHQFGGTIRPKNAPALIFSMGGEDFAVQSVTIPARPYMGISPGNRAEIVDTIADWLDSVIDRGG
jgi:phage virion morphogenesis protein